MSYIFHFQKLIVFFIKNNIARLFNLVITNNPQYKLIVGE